MSDFHANRCRRLRESRIPLLLAGATKLSDVSRKPILSLEQAQQLRALEAEGWTRAALAERFACSPTTISNYLNGASVARQEGPPLAREAVDQFVSGLGELHGERRALAAIAAALANRIDCARAAGSAAVAARTLADLIERLAADVKREQSEEEARRALQAIGL